MITTKKILDVVLLLLLHTAVFSQMGIGTTSPAPGAILDLTATNKALLLPRVVDVDLITSPVNGMIVYDELNKCTRAYDNGSWGNCLSGTAVQPSSGGDATVTNYSCNTGSIGVLMVGVPVAGVTQTITATVSTVGTYNIRTTTANGITFSGSGTFAGTGQQNVVLTADGTPTAIGSNTYTLKNTSPSCSFSRTAQVAVVTGITCTVSAGTMIVGIPVAGVTQTITATVTSIGAYNISATANGLKFSASGVFAGTGAQNVVLTGTGTPLAAGSSTFILDSTPSCSFNRITLADNRAVVSAYFCATASAGFLIVDTPVSGVTQTITATVTSVGTYNISTVKNNGITFSGYGNFTTTGAQAIILTASGTPTAMGSYNFLLNTEPNCSFSRYSSKTGCYANVAGVAKDFLCYNLGVVVTASSNPFIYDSGKNNGDLYQWGRRTDGHEKVNSATVTNLATNDAATLPTTVPGKFIIINVAGDFDWRSPQNNALWGDGTSSTNPVKAGNDPCPSGYKIPSLAQWQALFATNANTVSRSVNLVHVGPRLVLPSAGYRRNHDGILAEVGTLGQYHSSTVFLNPETLTSVGTSVAGFLLSGENRIPSTTARARGCSVRCIQDN